MALIVDQKTNYKHYCKVCKRGFDCGRALGGHMRAHGIGDESGSLDHDEQASEWEDKLGGNVPPRNRRMYKFTINRNRFKSYSEDADDGKCSSEDAESLVSSPGSEGNDGMNGRRGGSGWSRRKRSSEEVELANTLMMLSNGNVVAEPEESCVSASKTLERRYPVNFMSPSYRNPEDNKSKGVADKGLFECKACKKVFHSHQALGGHRASHKKVKGCFAADDSHADDDVITDEEFFHTKSSPALEFDHGANALMAPTSKRNSKVHQCSICHRVFSSGQALGGHKRCHWITSNASDTSTLERFQQIQEQLKHMSQEPKFDSEPLELKLDLSLSAPGEVARGQRYLSTEIYLQPWVGEKEADDDHCQSKKHHHPHYQQIVDDNNEDKNNKDSQTSFQNVDDEADSKLKLAKLSELKDMNLGGSFSAWLQVGLSSTVDSASAE